MDVVEEEKEEEEEKSASPEEEEEVWEVGPIDGAGGEGGLPREIEIGLSQSYFWDRVGRLCQENRFEII